MKNDFSTVVNRCNTGSLKWASCEAGGKNENAFPFSTADMEFAAPQPVRDAVSAFAQRGFFCYTGPDKKYRRTVCDFMERRHNWHIEPQWIVTTYGIVAAINTAVRAFTNEGDGVIIQRPVYRPFTAAVENNRRRVVNNALVLKDGYYTMNFDELEELCKDENNKLLILCSPHNPVGRVWTEEELRRVGEICLKNSVLVISDEIHFDICNVPHSVFTSVDSRFSENAIVCTAASKSFNIAGLSTSNIIIANEELRNEFSAQIERDGYSCINCAAYPATVAAYTECDGWLDEMNAVVGENFRFLDEYLRKNIPQAFIAKHEGTYLAWLNVSFLGLEEEELERFFTEKVKIVPTMGTWFGNEGEGFVRLNIAVPKSVLEEVLERFRAAVCGG